MKKFKVTARMSTFLEATVEAETLSEAQEIAENMDGGDFTETKDYGDWNIESVTEVSHD